MTSRGDRPFADCVSPVLLLIDLQSIFCDPSSPAFVPSWSTAEVQAMRVLKAFEHAGWPVYFSRHLHPADDDGGVMARFFDRLIRENSQQAELAQAWLPLAQRHSVFDKSRHSALSCPTFRECLAGHDALVLAGVQTHLCVLATALDAAARDITPLVVADACADRHPHLHRAALDVLGGGHAHLADCEQVLATWPEAIQRVGHE